MLQIISLLRTDGIDLSITRNEMDSLPPHGTTQWVFLSMSWTVSHSGRSPTSRQSAGLEINFPLLSQCVASASAQADDLQSG